MIRILKNSINLPREKKFEFLIIILIPYFAIFSIFFFRIITFNFISFFFYSEFLKILRKNTF